MRDVSFIVASSHADFSVVFYEAIDKSSGEIDMSLQWWRSLSMPLIAVRMLPQSRPSQANIIVQAAAV